MSKKRGSYIIFFTMFILIMAIINLYNIFNLKSKLFNGKLLKMNIFSIIIYAQDSSNSGKNDENPSDEDIFNEENFDKNLETSTQEAEKNKLQTLFGGNFSFSMPLVTTTDFDNYSLNGVFSGESFFKIFLPMVGLAYISYAFNYNLFYFSDLTSNSTLYDYNGKLNTNLMEFFFDFNIEKSIFFRIGTQVIHWGASYFWTPVDFINLEKFNATAYSDLRSGKPGIKITIPLNFPLKNSNFFAFIDLYNLNSSDRDLEKIPVSLRYDFNFDDWEFAISTNFGKNQKTYFGFDFSGNIFEVDVYGEISFSKGSDLPIVEESSGFVPYTLSYPDYVFRTSIGFQKSFGDDNLYSLSSEFFYNSMGYDEIPFSLMLIAQSATGLNLYIPFYLGKFYFYISFSKSRFISDYTTLSMYVVSNISDLSYMGSITFSLSLPDTLPLNFNIKYYGGGDNKEFTYGGASSNNNKLTFSFSTSISF